MSDKQRRGARALSWIGVLVLLLVLAASAAVGVSAARPTGCESCHLKNATFAEATRDTAHARADVSCVSCHVETSTVFSRAKFALYETYGMRLRLLDPSATDATLVGDARCLSCHAEVMTKTAQAGGLRIAHERCTTGRTCVECHSEVGHGSATKWPRTSAMNDCIACHTQSSAPVKCETCHLGKIDKTTSSKPEFSVTHGPNWQKTHGLGAMSSCSTCHGETTCLKCHGPGVPHSTDFIARHDETSQQEGAQCLTCHDKSFCQSCHLTDMPHSKEFIAGHSDTVKRDGKETCLRCHDEKDCDTCHVKHVHPGGAVGKIPSPAKAGE